MYTREQRRLAHFLSACIYALPDSIARDARTMSFYRTLDRLTRSGMRNFLYFAYLSALVTFRRMVLGSQSQQLSLNPKFVPAVDLADGLNGYRHAVASAITDALDGCASVPDSSRDLTDAFQISMKVGVLSALQVCAYDVFFETPHAARVLDSIRDGRFTAADLGNCFKNELTADSLAANLGVERPGGHERRMEFVAAIFDAISGDPAGEGYFGP